ncbi:MAG: NADPH:quinone oxidoreductase family protein [Proteobacteria bacterium]|nr:NADPH:quinone oxidoreductase family protein [Pseudomonadota bacterium]
MRALVCNAFGSPDELVIEERDDPEADSGEIVVDVAAAGINFPDILMIAGQYQVKTPPPFIPGNEAAGVVSTIGDRVSRLAVGDKVIITPPGGAFAEKCAVDENLVMPLPGELDFEQGAGYAITYGTSYHALKQSANVQPGETVLVLGAAGGVGITAVEIAKALGARVIAAASSAEKLEFAASAGADETVNYSEVSLKDTVKQLTDGKGADVIYDPVGGEMADQALRATAWHGRYLVIGFASGDIPKFPANIALLKEASIIGVWWGTWAAKNPEGQLENAKALAALVTAGKLKPRITESYAFDDYKRAFAAITERRALGKVVMRMT